MDIRVGRSSSGILLIVGKCEDMILVDRIVSSGENIGQPLAVADGIFQRTKAVMIRVDPDENRPTGIGR